MELSLHFSQNNRQMAPTWTVIQTTVLKNFQLNCLVNEQCINNILHELLTVKVTTLIALKYFAFCRFTAVSRKIHLFIATPTHQFPSPSPLPRGNAIIRALTSQRSWFSWQLSILMCCLGCGIWFENTRTHFNKSFSDHKQFFSGLASWGELQVYINNEGIRWLHSSYML